MEFHGPLPAGVAVPTVVPPMVQVVGKEAWGPNTLKVMVLVSLAPELAPRVAVRLVFAIVVPAVPVEGAATLRVGLAAETTVLVMLALLHRLAAALLLVSEGDDTYHQ